MLLSILHVTRYTYATPSRYAILALRLTPPSFEGQQVVDWQIRTAGIDAVQPFRDGFGNLVHLVTDATEHSETLIIAKGVVETRDTSGIVSGLREQAPARVFLRETPATTIDDSIRDIARSAGGGKDIGGLHALMHAVRDAVDYETGQTGAETTASEALLKKKGVCQDHAHIFIAASRSIGVPARYVSGYLLAGSDGPYEANHAWAEACVDGLGWVGFDIANRICPTESYVRLATGLDARSAAPVRGTRHGTAHENLDVIAEVQQQISQQQ